MAELHKSDVRPAWGGDRCEHSRESRATSSVERRSLSAQAAVRCRDPSIQEQGPNATKKRRSARMGRGLSSTNALLQEPGREGAGEEWSKAACQKHFLRERRRRCVAEIRVSRSKGRTPRRSDVQPAWGED